MKSVHVECASCEVEGACALAAACVFPVFDGMAAHTNTPKIAEYRRKNLQLLLSDHNMDHQLLPEVATASF